MKLVLIDESVVVLIYLNHHFLNLILCHLYPQGAHGVSELVEIDVSRAILIKKFESAIDFFLLYVAQALMP